METNSEQQVIDQIIKQTREGFSHQIEELVWEKDISYLDAICELSKKYDLEPEYIPRLLSKELLIKLQRESEKANLLKEKTNSLL